MKDIAPIVGTWKLASFEVQMDDDTVTYPFGENAKGTIIYARSGCFSIQLMRLNRPNFASGDQMKGTPEEFAASCEGCISCFGRYDFDEIGGFVMHNIEGSLFPNWEGQSHKRFFEMSNNRLKLSTPPTLWGGSEVVGVQVWERFD